MTAEFGCARCYGDDPESVLVYWTNSGLKLDTDVIDKSHFGVSLFHCGACGQRFVYVYTEFIDWTGGDDQDYTDRLPVTASEAARIQEQGEGLDLKYLGSLGAGRRRLGVDSPTPGPRSIGWRTGEFLVMPGY